MNVLIMAVHPDDEVLGCGGTMARLASEGARVHVLIIANGLTSRPGFEPVRDAATRVVNDERARRAGALFGATEVSIAGLPDQKPDGLALLEGAQTIEREAVRVRPECVFTQHGGDLKLDHALTFRATLTATRPMAGGVVRRVYSCEVPSSSEWAFGQFEPRFQPTVFFDISTGMETQIAAMKIYEGETRGAADGMDAGEAIHCGRCLH